MPNIHEPIAPGIYDFEVNEKEIKKSSKGNPMAAITLAVEGPDYTKWIYDYMMESDKKWAVDKKRAFCACCGMPESTDLIDLPGPGSTGQVKIGIEKEQDKEDGSGDVWPAKNKVMKYIPAEERAIPTEQESLPF